MRHLLWRWVTLFRTNTTSIKKLHGSNVPLTRTPDAHFLTEVRYKGTKVVSVSPDYAESTTSSDAWLNVKAGTDAALAMAMGHVILKEYYIDKETPYFKEYAKEFTDMPFLVRVEDINGAVQPGRFLNAKDLGSKEEGADFQTVLIAKVWQLNNSHIFALIKHG